MARNTDGRRHQAQEMFGPDLMQWSQDQALERLRFMLLGMADEYGFVGRLLGSWPLFDWQIYDAGSGALALRDQSGSGVDFGLSRIMPRNTPLLGVDRNGRVIEMRRDESIRDSSNAVINVPNDGVWRTLVVRYGVTTYEPGTINLTGSSTTITGTGTDFTRYGQSSDPEASIIRVAAADSSNGNEGSYEIATITDATNATLVSAPPADETAVRFRIEAQFFSGSPADPDAHHNPTAFWELVTRTTTRPTDGALVVYDVMRTGGVTTFIDRRHANIYRQRQPPSGVHTLIPSGLYRDNTTTDVDDASGVLELQQSMTFVLNDADSTTQVHAVALAPCATGSHTTGLASDQSTGMMLAAIVDDGTTRTVHVQHYTQVETYSAHGGDWDNPDGGGAVSIEQTAGLRDVALVALPSNSGNTHIAFVVNSAGNVHRYTTTDNGATWSAGTLTLNPTGAVEVLRVAACLTRMGRLVVIVLTDTANTVRAIYSDDLGSTWDTNSNDGYDIGGTTGATDVSVCEDDLGNVWTVVAQGTNNGVKLWRGGGEGDAVPDATEQTAGWDVGLEQDAENVECFGLPKGGCGIVFDGNIGQTDRRVYYSCTERRDVLHVQTLTTFANNPGEDLEVHVSIAPMSSGHMMMVHSERSISGGPLYSARVCARTFALVETQRSLAWHGGE